MLLLDGLSAARRLLLLIVVIGSAAEAAAQTIRSSSALGCGPADQKKFNVVRHKEPPALDPTPSRATLYVMSYSFGGKRKIGVNGEWIAATNNASYAIVQVDPGILRLCAAHEKSEVIDVINAGMLTAEAGKTYYLVDRAYSVVNRASGGWEQLDESGWRRLLDACKKCPYVTSRIRQ